MPPSAGMRFGRYELLSPLGAGGMGEVWRARDHDLHRDVAVKFLPERFAADPSRMGRFAQEARAASSLSHPNIVTIHEIGQTSGLPFIVMEVVEGQTLREPPPRGRAAPRRSPAARDRRPDRRRPRQGPRRRHRPPGPEARERDGDAPTATSRSWTSASPSCAPRARAARSTGSTRRRPPGRSRPRRRPALGVVLGTAGYMSPEQARGREVDYRSDQFTLGAILYEMATGRQAFLRETPAQTIAAIIEDPPQPLAELCPQMPPPVRWVIERCLEKEPAARYASTLDLARELKSLREHLAEVGGSSPSSPTVGQAVRPGAARHGGRRACVPRSESLWSPSPASWRDPSWGGFGPRFRPRGSWPCCLSRTRGRPRDRGLLRRPRGDAHHEADPARAFPGEPPRRAGIGSSGPPG